MYEVTLQSGALNMDKWHTCKTTHCRAGWVIHLSGEGGKKLEERLSTPIAALRIYRESSDLEVHIADFYKTNEEAMEDIKRLSELEEDKKNKLRKQSESEKEGAMLWHANSGKIGNDVELTTSKKGVEEFKKMVKNINLNAKGND